MRPALALDPTRAVSQYGHDAWNHQNGLPAGAVYTVAQSPDGYLWMRQASGVVRFDGVRFVQVTPVVNNEVVRENIRAIVKTADGSLLLRGPTRTLRGTNGKFADAVPPAKLLDGMERVIYQAKDGTIWVGSDSNLFRFKNSQLQAIVMGTGWVSAITEDKDGAVWFGASCGIFRFKEEKLTYYPTGFNEAVLRTFLPTTTSPYGLPQRTAVTALFEDKAGVLWVGTRTGLYKRVGEKFIQDRETRGVPGVFITAFLQDAEGSLWVGTDGLGLYRMANNTWTKMSIQDGLSDNGICSLLEDQEGSIWIGTRSGLDRLRDTPLMTMTAREGMSHDNAAAVAEAKDGSIYVFTAGGGITHLKGGEVPTAITTDDGIGSDEAGTLYAARDGTLWIGTDRGLSSYKDGTVTNYPDQAPLNNAYISSICEDDESLILASSQLLLYRFKNGVLSPYDLAVPPGDGPKNARYVFAMNCDEEGTMWIAMTAGLYRVPKGVPPEKGECSTYSDPVHSFTDDGRGYIWLAGPATRGIVRLRKSDGQLFAFGPALGLDIGEIATVRVDRVGNLWLGTHAGIVRVFRQELDDVAAGKADHLTPFTYGVIDGMKAEEVSDQQPSSCLASDGRLYFGTRKGLVILDPEHLKRNTRVPEVVIEEFLADRQERPMDRVTLSAGTENFELHYTALSLLAPSRIRFKYQLLGYDANWVDADNRRTAYYTHLPPGDYTFRVVASNGDGAWNQQGATLRFTLRPHFYQTIWFYVCCIGLVIVIGNGAHRLRTRRLRARKEELVKIVDERTQALREEVAEKNRAQKELQNYRDYLEHVVTERTAELQRSNEQLQCEIVERRASEDALRLSEDRYRRFFEEDLAGAFIASPSGALITCNPSFLRIFGFNSPADVAGVNVSSFFDRPADASDALARVKKMGQLQDCELAMRSNDGRSVNVLANLIGRFDSEGQLTEIKGYVIDMTERKRLENQLRQSQKMEAVGQLAGGVAHDFNNLLTAIIGSSDCILDVAAADSETMLLAKEIREAGKRAAGLTRQLLAFSRKQVLQPRVILVNDVVTEMETMLQRLIGEDVRLELSLASDLKFVRADPSQLQQIVLNLSVNARDAMPSGGRLRIETQNVRLHEPLSQGTQSVPPGRYVCLRVTDSGIGMSPEVQAHIFEPFFTTKGVGKGTGLGLSTVYGIVQQSNGYVTFASAPNRGTSFSIFLTQVEAPHTPASTPAHASAKVVGKETVLLVEDNELVLKVAQRTLESVGFQVLEAANAAEAIRRFENEGNSVDLLLTDVVMPDMNGPELAKKILAMDSRIEVLFMSGYTEDALVRVGGVQKVALIEKPFTPDALVRRVREALDARTVRR
ncbi:MAG TPA: two-component regulator propeller domain-containing protein [Opitutaceae bacterium]|nr:two-component regulator propeller domain-containing protein [Opitutaceae bacterium]